MALQIWSQKKKIKRIKMQWTIAIFVAVIISFVMAWSYDGPLIEKVQRFLLHSICWMTVFTLIRMIEVRLNARKRR